MKYFYFASKFFLIFLFTSHSVYASTWVTSVSFDNNFSVIVQPQQSVPATINVSTWFDNSNPNDTANWYSTQYTISGKSPVCVDTKNFNSSDFHQDIFNFSAPYDEGVYSITFQAFASENCTGGAITKSLTLTEVITVIDTTPPVITINPYNLNPTDQNITVVASANEGLLNFSSHTFTQNGFFEFIATDLAGNITKKTITITNINKNNSSSNNETSTSTSQTNTSSQSTNFTPLTSNRFNFLNQNKPSQTLKIDNNKNILGESQNIKNISSNSGQILGSVDIHAGCWLPILFIITLVINFFFVRYSTKFTNLIPFVISVLSFSVDYLMLKKYGCDITWLAHYFWIGEILSFLIPVIFKYKISRR
jgi:hypothetical protein